MTTTIDIARPCLPPGRHMPSARLELRRRSSRVTITAAEEMARLCRTSFKGSSPKLRQHARTITIQYPLIAPTAWLQPTRQATTITLAAEEPWEIVSTGRIAHLRVDLSDR